MTSIGNHNVHAFALFCYSHDKNMFIVYRSRGISISNSTLRQTWPSLIDKTVRYAAKVSKNARHQQMVKQFEETQDEVLFAHILCGLLHPGLVKGRYKPSIRDVERGFVHTVEVKIVIPCHSILFHEEFVSRLRQTWRDRLRYTQRTCAVTT